MDICRYNRADKGGAFRSTRALRLFPFTFFLTIIAGWSRIQPGYPWYPSHNARDQSFGSHSRFGAGRGRAPGTPPSCIIQGGSGSLSIWYRSPPVHCARCSQWSELVCTPTREYHILVTPRHSCFEGMTLGYNLGDSDPMCGCFNSGTAWHVNKFRDLLELELT